jgi:hypothetical protein
LRHSSFSPYFCCCLETPYFLSVRSLNVRLHSLRNCPCAISRSTKPRSASNGCPSQP